jgi:hypothetical protein
MASHSFWAQPRGSCYAAWALRAVLDPLETHFSQFISNHTYFVVGTGESRKYHATPVTNGVSKN